MNRESLRSAYSIELRLSEVEDKLHIWNTAHSWGDFDRLTTTIKEPGSPLSTTKDHYLRDIPFGKLKVIFIEHHETKKRELEEILNTIMTNL